jgi:DNA-binding winged helix-turn-helix (wHTH) protein
MKEGRISNEQGPRLSGEARRYEFGEFRLDPTRGSLRCGDQEIEIPPKAFQVLIYLVEHCDRVVPKQELMETLWKGTFVTDDALVQAVLSIRRALGDESDQPRFIRTKPRVGYQFMARVEETAAGVPESVAPVGRNTARKLFLVMQGGYLVLYSLALVFLNEAVRVVVGLLGGSDERENFWRAGIVFLALCGVAIRLYLIAAVALDHPRTKEKFSWLFPGLLLLDLVWALSPLLVAEDTGLPIALALVPVLAYGPFSQRTLIRTAYSVPVKARDFHSL